MNRLHSLFSGNQNFSLLNLFSLPGGENSVELRTKFRQIGVFYWACLIFPPYFIAEQYFIFKTDRYLPLLFSIYGLLALAPLIYRYLENFRIYAGYTLALGIGLVYIIMACAGGNLSPGAFWLVGTPLVFGIFYGTRGVLIGSGVMAMTFTGFVILNHWQLLPNLVAEHGDYEQVKLVNLIGFGIYNILISYYFINNEESAKIELRLQRQESENLLRILVHDVANPINAIQLMTHAVKTGRRDPEQILLLIDGALGELSSIVQQVRKLRALQDGKLALELSQVPIQALLNESIDLLHQQASHKQIGFDLDMTSDTALVQVDEALLKNVVFANLISNAIKFSHPGQRISIQLSVNQDWVTVTVADRGIGMSANLMRQIFDPTVPTTRPGTNGERGTGYGMPLVKTLLSKMGGEIVLESSQAEAASGTRISISLPRYHTC